MTFFPKRRGDRFFRRVDHTVHAASNAAQVTFADIQANTDPGSAAGFVAAQAAAYAAAAIG